MTDFEKGWATCHVQWGMRVETILNDHQNGWNLGYWTNFSCRRRWKYCQTLRTHFGAKNGPFLPQNCVFGWFWNNWGHFYTFLISKVDEYWLTSSILKVDEEKKQFVQSPHVLGPKMSHFCPENCVFGEFWDNWRHFYTFENPKWMKLSILHQL